MLVLLYEFPAETRLTVYRRLDIPKHSHSLDQAPANIREFCHRVCIFGKVLYYKLLVCSINFEDITLEFYFG